MKNDGLKILLGVAIGTAIGAAIAYFSDEEKRNNFIDDVTDMKDSLQQKGQDMYYDARIKGRKAKRDMSRYMADMKDSAMDAYGNAKDKMLRTKEDIEEKVSSSIDEAKESVEKASKEVKEEINKAKA